MAFGLGKWDVDGRRRRRRLGARRPLGGHRRRTTRAEGASSSRRRRSSAASPRTRAARSSSPPTTSRRAHGIADSRGRGPRRTCSSSPRGYAEPELQRGPRSTRAASPRATSRRRPASAGRSSRASPTTTTRKAPGTVAAGRYLEVELFDGRGARRVAEEDLPLAAHAQRHHARRALRLGRLRQRDEVGLRR